MAIGGTSFEQALLDDMLPAPGARCSAEGSMPSAPFEHTSTFTFPGSDPKSEWHPPYVSLEKRVFLAEMEHLDSNSNRTWRLRVGSGGNPYSFVGAFGEAMPPQAHDQAPWIDEVWQMVAVDTSKNKAETPYFIHQAGTYQREAVLREKPFYSPNVASHCSKEDRSCSFVSWGQQAHVPTEYTSPMLYYTRYQDCGNGVVEATWMMYNMGTSGGVSSDTPSYLNVPWGGVRTSNLRDAVVEVGGKTNVLSPLAKWGDKAGQVIRDLDSFDGYTAFAQALPRSSKAVALPSGLALKKAGSCRESAGHTSSNGRLTLRMPLARTGVVKTGTTDSFTLTNPAGEQMIVGGVLHWAWGGTALFFFPENQDSASAVAQCNAWKNGDVLTVGLAPGSGKPEEDNLGLAFVHGSESAGIYEGDITGRIPASSAVCA